MKLVTALCLQGTRRRVLQKRIGENVDERPADNEVLFDLNILHPRRVWRHSII